ncbi:SAM-dependent methyltransferase [Sulfurimonas sp.]
MKLQNVVPWGRNLQEYRAMGLFRDEDLHKKILGCGDGPASVNKTLSQMGVDITSIDPVYQFTREQIAQRVQETSSVVSEQLRLNSDDFVWKNITNVEELISLRLNAMEEFLEDYETGKIQGRYQHQELPKLNFNDKEFDLSWSSHFLFLYSEHFDFAFHKKAILEMLRVAKEVRIFPLLTLENVKSPHLKPVIEFLNKQEFVCEIISSEYEFQKGAFEMLRIVHV